MLPQAPSRNTNELDFAEGCKILFQWIKLKKNYIVFSLLLRAFIILWHKYTHVYSIFDLLKVIYKENKGNCRIHLVQLFYIECLQLDRKLVANVLLWFHLSIGLWCKRYTLKHQNYWFGGNDSLESVWMKNEDNMFFL